MALITDTEAPPLASGSVLAGYRIEGILGRGGMGIVYRATQLSLGRTVALKVLAPRLTRDQAFHERFRREGLLQATLDHPHIIPVYEAGETDRGLFLAMQLIRGRTLKSLVISGARDSERMLSLLGAIADALDFAHGEGLIHRDVKPQNILVSERDHPYLADFGLTKAADGETLTQAGQFLGTIDYMPPEQIQGRPATPRSDVYSLGAVLYESLAGVPPYPRDSHAAAMYAHLFDAPPKVTAARSNLPAGLDLVVAQAMAKDPDDRYASAGELIADAHRAFSPTGKVRAVGRPHRPPQHRDVDLSPTVTSAGAAGIPSSTDPTVVPRTSRSPIARALPIALVGILALSATGFAAGRTVLTDDAPAGSNLATSDPLQLIFPDSWKPASGSTSVPGLKFRSAPIALAPAGRSADRLVAGQTSATGPTLLPRGLLRRLARPPRRDDPVRIGSVDAYRYRGLRPAGFQGTLDLYAAPTADGVATVACVLHGSDSASFARRCERVADSLQLVGVRAAPLGADRRYARRVEGVLDRLDTGRRATRRRLADARTRDRQAGLAGELAALHRRAASQIAATDSSPVLGDLHARLGSALTRLARAYERMGGRAREGDAGGWASARAQARGLEREVDRTVRQLDQRA